MIVYRRYSIALMADTVCVCVCVNPARAKQKREKRWNILCYIYFFFIRKKGRNDTYIPLQ